MKVLGARCLSQALNATSKLGRFVCLVFQLLSLLQRKHVQIYVYIGKILSIVVSIIS